MRVLMVLIALVATPFLAGFAQGKSQGKSGHDASTDVRDARNDHDGDRDARNDHDDDRGDGQHARRGDGECKDKHADRGHHYGWRHGQHDDCNPAAPLLGGISGTVFFDMSYDGVHDADEAGLANWLVMLSGPVNTSTLTDADGNYSFTGLPAGTYTVCESQRFGWIQTAPQGASSCTSGFGYTIVIPAGGSAPQQDFGNVG